MAGSKTFSYSYPLAKGAIQYRLEYEDLKSFVPTYTSIYSTTIR